MDGFNKFLKTNEAVMGYIAENWVAFLIASVIFFLMSHYGIKTMNAKQERKNKDKINRIFDSLEERAKKLGNFSIFTQITRNVNVARFVPKGNASRDSVASM